MALMISNQALAALCRQLNAKLAGGTVKKIQELPGGGYKFRLVANKRDADLILQPHYLFLAPESMPAKKMTTGFGAFLNKQLEGQPIQSISTLRAERIVKIAFRSLDLYLECFAEGNLVLADSDGKILGLEKRAEWKGRTLAKGETYKAPESSARDPGALDADELHVTLMASAKRLVPALVQLVNTAGPIAEHAVRKAGLATDAPAKSTMPEQVAAIADELKKIYDPETPISFGLVRRGENDLLVRQALDVPDYSPLAGEVGQFLFMETTKAPLNLAKESTAGRIKSPKESPLENAILRQQKAREDLAAEGGRYRANAHWIQAHRGLVHSILEAVRAGENPIKEQKPPIQAIAFDAKKKLLFLEIDDSSQSTATKGI